MSFEHSFKEALKIKKMNLPKFTPNNIPLEWNDKPGSHNFFDRVKRANLNRNEVIPKILKSVDELSNLLSDGGPFIISFTESEFYLSVFVETFKKIPNERITKVTIKTILTHDMKLRQKDRVLDIKEAEKLFNLDLREFYEDGFVNSYYGSLLIEESLDRKSLEVFPDIIEIEL